MADLGETLFKLRSPNYKELKVTAPSGGYTAGALKLVGNTVVIIVETVDAGEEVTAVWQAEKVLVPCVAVPSGAFTKGSKVYYDVADAEVNQSSSGNYLCGIVLEQPAVGAESVEIAFDGTLCIVT